MKYEVIIGLEVHVQLNTASKMFCGCGTKFGGPPNTQTCPVCLGLPGVLPVMNKKALILAMRTALAFNCTIAEFTKFDRKHYFYPDLPKNFQTSQYDKPLSYGGFLGIDADKGAKKIRIKRIHLEEDAGKLIHQEEGGFSLIDYNRTGIPLLEIVTEPDLRSPQEAYRFLLALRDILGYLDVSTCNMEEGSLRCDANISVRPVGQTALGVKTEVKNMNSFKAVRQALEYEAKRQMELVRENKGLVQETRLWDSEAGRTDSMRSKEEAHDYRYFPEPDLLPVAPSDALVDGLRRALPEMPKQRRQRFIETYGLSDYDAGVLTMEKQVADFFEETAKKYNKPKVVANWIMGDLAAVLSDTNLTVRTISLGPDDLADMLFMIDSGAISGKMAKDILREAIGTKKKPPDIVREKALSQITDVGPLKAAIEKVLSQNQKAVDDLRAGKETAITFLVGQVMKETKGKANPGLVNKLLKERLGKAKAN